MIVHRLKGNCHGKIIFFLHFAFFSSPIYIDMCGNGKILKLLVKYALSYGHRYQLSRYERDIHDLEDPVPVPPDR